MRKTEIGEKVRFTPECMIADAGGNLMKSRPMDQREEVTGEVVYIHEAHHWYRAQYQMAGSAQPQYQCFPLPVEADPDPPRYYALHIGSRRGRGRPNAENQVIW